MTVVALSAGPVGDVRDADAGHASRSSSLDRRGQDLRLANVLQPTPRHPCVLLPGPGGTAIPNERSDHMVGFRRVSNRTMSWDDRGHARHQPELAPVQPDRPRAGRRRARRRRLPDLRRRPAGRRPVASTGTRTRRSSSPRRAAARSSSATTRSRPARATSCRAGGRRAPVRQHAATVRCGRSTSTSARASTRSG